ncbi:MAG TPA: hypothetical protein VMN60_09215, partial [Longimicrobiales bacterium]|nr:hypothetical protein [Longimicrobiales bacterium]
TTEFTGSPASLPATLAKHVRFTGAAALAADLIVNQNVTVASSGSLAIGPHTLNVGGIFALTNSATFSMTDAASVLDVAGAVTINGQSTSGLLTAGELRVAGNFTQGSGSVHAAAFAPSGTHRTIFDGTAAQTASFWHPGTTSSRFQHVEITGAGGVTFTSNVFTGGDVDVTSALTVASSTTTSVGGSLIVRLAATLTNSGTVNAATCLLSGLLIGTAPVCM